MILPQLRRLTALVVLATGVTAAIGAQAPDAGGERAFLTRVRRLTIEGRRSGEGYWSRDGRQLVFQSEREPGNPFYQIYLMDMETGKAEMVLSLERMAAIAYPKGLPPSGHLYFFREGWNPSGTRFVAFIKDPANQLFEAYSVAPDGTDVRYLYHNPSHHSWRDDRHILDFGHHAPPGDGSPQGGYFLFEDDGTGKAREYVWPSNHDGHDSYVPGPGGDWILSDTYVLAGYQYLFLFHVPSRLFVPLARLKSTADDVICDGSCRVDLHPRLSRDGRKVSIDATHEGLGRQMYVLDIGHILDHPPARR